MATYIPQGVDGATAPTNTVPVGGKDGSGNLQSIHTDTDGDTQVDVLSSALPAGAATSALQTQPGVDIGDVTINNAAGAAAVNIQDGGNSITVDGTVASAAELADGATFTPASSTVAMIGAELDDVSPAVIAEGKGGAIRMNARRSLHVVVKDNAGNERGMNVDSSGRASVLAAQTTATNLKTAADLYLSGTAVDSANPVPITSDSSSPIFSCGAVAEGDPASAFPPMADGGVGRTTNATPATDGDTVYALHDDLGRKVVTAHQVRDLCADITPLTLTTTTAVTDLIANDASNMNDILSLVCVNTSATGTEVVLYNDDGTTVRFGFYVPANDMRGIVFGSPLKGEAVNKKWKIKCATSISSLKVFGQYMKNGA